MAPNRFIDYFVVCGLGPELVSIEGQKGYHGTAAKYQPALLDQLPVKDHPDGGLPPQLPMCCLPGGVEFYVAGSSETDWPIPKTYPVVLTEGDGTKNYVSCLSFRDPVDEDISATYRIPPSSYSDKVICIVSHWPFFEVFREVLEELHKLCFSPTGSSKPLWSTITDLISVPLPVPGQSQVLFAVENCLLSAQAPPRDGLPYAELSFQPLVQCLDIEKFTRVFTAVLLEKRVLLRASKYSLLTVVAEALCHLLYPIKWQHVYIPVLPYALVDIVDAPTPYLMGLHSGVHTGDMHLDGVVVVDLDQNQVNTTEDIPQLPEPEGTALRQAILELVHPNLADMDRARTGGGATDGIKAKRLTGKPWSRDHDRRFRFVFLQFFASLLENYREYIDHDPAAEQPFNSTAFLLKRTKNTKRPAEPMLSQLLGSQGFIDFLERGYGSERAGPNMLDKVMLAAESGTGGGDALLAPPRPAQTEIITVQSTTHTKEGSSRRGRHSYDRFPAAPRSREAEERRKALLASAMAALNPQASRSAAAAGSAPNGGPATQRQREGGPPTVTDHKSPQERAAERELMILDIRVKQQVLWRKFLEMRGPDLAASTEYGTLFALIDSDPDGSGGSGLVECIREFILEGGSCELDNDHFDPVKELLKTVVKRATSRDDFLTVQFAMDISAQLFRRDSASVCDYIQRHIGHLPVWESLLFWETAFATAMEQCPEKGLGRSRVALRQLLILADHMVGLSVPDAEAWAALETIALRNSVGYIELVKLRGALALMEQLRSGYWGLTPGQKGGLQQRSQGLLNLDGNHNPGESLDAADHSQGDLSLKVQAWARSMFAKEKVTLDTKPSPGKNKAEKLLGGGLVGRTSVEGKLGGGAAGIPRVQDFAGSRGGDCTVKLWNPERRGEELLCTMEGHTKLIRCLGSDRIRLISGADDARIVVWDKNSGHLLVDFNDHEDKVSCVRLVQGQQALSGSYDCSVRMWDLRTSKCVALLGKHAGPVLCLDHDFATGLVATGGTDGVCNLWDIRGGKLRHRLVGHNNWIRAVRLSNDTLVTGSDDWTACVWGAASGLCGAVLACHSGGVTCVDFSPSGDGILTGSVDSTVRFWEREEGTASMRCVETVGVHNGPILGVKASEAWIAIGAADNSMALFHRPEGVRSSVKSLQKSRMAEYQLLRTMHKSAAMVRAVACDVIRARVCSGGRNGVIRLWEPSLPG
ncbi:Calmodulin-binding protein CRAG [Klebsormidium nitens]|uniref:Calmodulin-binding protein CRAG n=1 Tax=Klebsormidium nitens TaxID=105231 RepID=A0A1Y1I177_KLENI|nr:Calmodulin-binding protein CRAG [Klebsormidium nitens]|eukprot:GAQ82931.1 Calmodulin-binding protein CRAG [Klebsormidium nitens]